jgi:acyl-CoA reductase-like NAD-dependent aldehyde dehydrogenase
MAEDTDLGPLARPDLRDDLHDQVRRSVDAGAACLAGGEALERDGYFYAPTLLDRVRPGMAAFDEETFGPVAAVTRAADVDEAVALANASRYGLGGSVWTRDRVRGEQVARRLECGCAFVNGIVKSDPRLPFGGVKDSGYGRELSALGIREFVNAKTVWVD